MNDKTALIVILLIGLFVAVAVAVAILGWVVVFWLFKVNPLWGIGAGILWAIVTKSTSATVKVRR